MARRNPQNERYRKDAQIGSTRRSASSAKPKRSAGSVDSRGGTGGSKATAKNKIPFEPDTPRFRRWRKYWLGLLVAAIVFSLGAYWQQGTVGGTASLIMAYTCLAAGVYIDITKIRRMRKEWRAEQEELAKGKNKTKKAEDSKATKGDKATTTEANAEVDQTKGKD